MKTLYLIRGASGSGKSTLANIIAAQINGQVCEADKYFVNDDGVYRFDRTKLPQAHAYCQAIARQSMQNNQNTIISNTFTANWEMNVYKEMAAEYGFKIFEVICNNDFGDVHNVPEEMKTIQRNKLKESLI